MFLKGLVCQKNGNMSYLGGSQNADTLSRDQPGGASVSLAFARMPRAEARGGSAYAKGYCSTGMATGDRGVPSGAPVLVRRQRLWPTVFAGLLRHSSQKGYEGRVTLYTEDGKMGGFGGVPLGFATDAPRGSAGSSTSRPNP